MKSKLLTLTLAITLLLICQFAFAQVEQNAKDRSRFGIKAGVNYSTISYGGTEKFSSDIGFNIGGTYAAVSGKRITLPIEVMYVQYAFHSTGDNYMYSSINLNSMLNYFVSKNFFIEGGMVAALYLNGSATNKKTNIKTDLTTAADVGLGLGLGYEFTNRVFFNVRGSYGFLPVFIDDDKSSNLICPTFNIGYSF